MSSVSSNDHSAVLQSMPEDAATARAICAKYSAEATSPGGGAHAQALSLAGCVA